MKNQKEFMRIYDRDGEYNAYLTFIIVGVVFTVIWQVLELFVHGEVQPSGIDTIILILFASVFTFSGYNRRLDEQMDRKYLMDDKDERQEDNHTEIKVTLDKPHGHIELKSTSDLVVTTSVYLDAFTSILRLIELETGEPITKDFCDELIGTVVEKYIEQDYKPGKYDQIRKEETTDD